MCYYYEAANLFIYLVYVYLTLSSSSYSLHINAYSLYENSLEIKLCQGGSYSSGLQH